MKLFRKASGKSCSRGAVDEFVHIEIRSPLGGCKMTPLTTINPPGVSWPGVSQGVMIKGSGVFLSSGIVPVDEAGNLVDGDFEAQVIAVYEGIGRLLRAAGLGFESIGRLVTYVTEFDPSMLLIIRKVRGRYLSQDAPPAGVLIAAAALYDPRVRIEVEFIAIVP
jgi:2-iminobutanoate/2-iminopropanoate deaminase